MEFLSTIGLLIALFMALLGTASTIFVLVLGSQVLRKRLRLGEACQAEADRVMEDLRVPTFQGRER